MPNYDALIESTARAHGLDPILFRRQIMAESGGNAAAVSPKGAGGLGQLMPDTARMLGVTNVNDPKQNLEGSATYMQRLLASHGNDQAKALAAYNWGPGNLARAGGDVTRAPAETQGYLQRVLGTDAASFAQASLPPPPPEAPAPPPVTPPGAAPPMPSQLNNQQLMQQRMAEGGGVQQQQPQESNTLATLLAGVPGANPSRGLPGMAPPAPAAPSMRGRIA